MTDNKKRNKQMIDMFLNFWEAPKNPQTVRLSQIIQGLQRLHQREGDLICCLDDEQVLFPTSSDDVDAPMCQRFQLLGLVMRQPGAVHPVPDEVSNDGLEAKAWR